MNKRGTSMVEAAMVFPLVILAVVGMIYILIFFYQQVERQSDMHGDLRQEAGRLSGKTVSERKMTYVLPLGKQGEKVHGAGTLPFSERGLLRQSSKWIEGDWHIVKPKETARYFDLLSGRGETDE